MDFAACGHLPASPPSAVAADTLAVVDALAVVDTLAAVASSSLAGPLVLPCMAAPR